MGRRKLIAAKRCQGSGVEQGTQEETGLLGREEGKSTAQRSGSAVEMVSECREVRRSAGTEGLLRGDEDVWQGGRALNSPRAVGRDGDLLNQRCGPVDTSWAQKGTNIASEQAAPRGFW